VRPHAVTCVVPTPNPNCNSPTSSFGYDANGNMISRTENSISYTQTFDAENRLTQVTISSTGQKWQFIYDGDGNRLKAVEPDGVTVLYPNGSFERRLSPTRAQLAVWLLKAKEGSSYTPLAATGIFQDVPTTHWAAAWIEELYNRGITAGCSTNPLKFCPDDLVARDSMAVLVLKTKYNTNVPYFRYSPFDYQTSSFTDVGTGHLLGDWIEAFYDEDFTAGCGTDLYCPSDWTTRAYAAIWLLKLKYGTTGWSPPEGIGVFVDVPDGHWAEDWIEKAYSDGITGGCAYDPAIPERRYCPDNAQTDRWYYAAGGTRVAEREKRWVSATTSSSNTLYFLLGDHLGSTAITASSTGAFVAEVRYKPWGENRYNNGTTPTTYRFTGQRREGELGLYFYNARWYDPAIGRFVSADTIVPEPGNPQSLNRYAYALNNPVKYTDPSGYLSEDEIMLHFGVESWQAVLAIFENGGALEGRWGWLETLRMAEIGDEI